MASNNQKLWKCIGNGNTSCSASIYTSLDNKIQGKGHTHSHEKPKLFYFMNVPDIYRLTMKGQKFLYADSGLNLDRILIFTTCE